MNSSLVYYLHQLNHMPFRKVIRTGDDHHFNHYTILQVGGKAKMSTEPTEETE